MKRKPPLLIGLAMLALVISVALFPLFSGRTYAAAVVTPIDTYNSKEAVWSWSVSGINAGDTLILCAATDNDFNYARYYYDGSNYQTFTEDNQVENAGHGFSTIFRISVAEASQVGAFIRCSTSAGSAAYTLYTITGLDASPLDAVNNSTGTGTDASTGSTGLLAQDDEVVVAATSVEDEVDDAHGSWTTGTGYVSGNELFDATNGGGDAGNVQCHSVVKIVTDGTSQAYQGVDAGHDSSLWAACIVSYKVATGCSPSISLNVYSWNVSGGAAVDLSSTYNTGLTYFTITNNSGGAVDITIHGTDMTGGGFTWTLSDTATAGDMIYGMKAGLSGTSYNITVKKNAVYNTLVAGLADSGTQDFGLELYTPTVFDDPNVKSGTIVLTVACT